MKFPDMIAINSRDAFRRDLVCGGRKTNHLREAVDDYADSIVRIAFW